MSFAVGVVLFALGIGISIALHEAGHMWSAKAFGMKVRRYFIGFGPTVFSVQRGETEYGLKWIPAGGFCDIAGMTALDPVSPEETPRAFFRRATWKRVIVLSAGSIMHFLIGIVLVYVLAVTSGLPSMNTAAVAGDVSACLPTTQDPVTLKAGPCDSAAPTPAAAAGIQPGDTIVGIAGRPTSNWEDAVKIIRDQRGPTVFEVQRDGRPLRLTVDVATVQRVASINAKAGPGNKVIQVGAVGMAQKPPDPPVVYNPVSAVPATFAFTGYMFELTGQGLLSFPQKIPAVWQALGGGDPDPERPVSVVGATVIGGDAVQAGSWATFILLLAALNFFIGVFNLVPLLPLDGGHIAVNLYERVRDLVRRQLGKSTMPPVDYTRLLPVTYAFIVVLGAIGILTIAADIINPIRL